LSGYQKPVTASETNELSETRKDRHTILGCVTKHYLVLGVVSVVRSIRTDTNALNFANFSGKLDLLRGYAPTYKLAKPMHVEGRHPRAGLYEKPLMFEVMIATVSG